MLQYQERGKMGGEKFHIRKGSLTFSADSIDMDLVPGAAYEGSFTIYGPEGRTANGFVLSSEPAMRLMTNIFSGAKEVISYRLDAAGLSFGDQLDGSFRILSDMGEYEIPFHAKVKEETLESSLGPMKNLLHFTNLARANWREAADLFYRKEFEAVAAKEGERIHSLYRGLSAVSGNEHNMEEFLIAAGKKQPVEYTVDQKELAMDLPASQTQKIPCPIRLRRNGWGYTRVRIFTSGDFLTVDAGELTDSLFRDQTAVITVIVDPSALHAGRNFGAITLLAAYGEAIRIPVVVSSGMGTALRTIHRREQKQVILQMMQEYVQMRCHKCSGKTFAAHMGGLVQKLQDADRNNPMTALYKIHYLLTVHKEQEAIWELEAFNRRLSGTDEELPPFSSFQFDLEDDLTYAYRMYLTVLCAESEAAGEQPSFRVIDDAVRELAKEQRRNPENFWITWLLLYADTERMRRTKETARMLRKNYEAGCRSPLLYLEYYQLMQESADFWYELGDMELQTLYFAAKHEILTEPVITQLNYLAIRRKTFSERLFRILAKAYEAQIPDLRRRDVLESICTLLIRGNETDPSCFVWYQRGVDAGLTITRLLDYYMLSLPVDYKGGLPQMIVRYFAFQNSLPAAASAYLYRYVLENKESCAELMDQYLPQILRFTQEQLLQQRMSPDLAFLYEAYLTSGRALSGEAAAAAVPAVFSCFVREKTARAGRLVLVYPHFGEEQLFPLKEGRAFVPVYGEDAALFFEEDNGDRRVGSPDEAEHLLNYRKLAKLLSLYGVSNIGFDLYLAGLGKTDYPVTEETSAVYRSLAENPLIPESFRGHLRSELLRFYEKQGDTKNLDDFLEKLEPEGLDAKSRNEMLRALSVRGFAGKAASWVQRFGTNGVDGDVLLRICTELLEEKVPADDEDLTELSFLAFSRGSYNETVLTFLAGFWDGLTSEMNRIRLALKGFDLEEGVLERRMLRQMLFTGEYLECRSELISDCRKDGTDSELLADALAQASHFYFTGRKEMSEEEFDLTGEFGRQGVPLLDICRIAWLKHRSEQSGEIADKDLEVTSLFLSDLLSQKIVFPFFRQFIGVLPGLQAYADETLVEYRSSAENAGKRVLYHYAMEQNGIRDPYAAKEMKEMYEGVYVTGFLLFFGEQMHYYITDDDAEKNVVESGTIGQDARTPVSGQDRFRAINEIAMLTALGRDAEALSHLEKYSRKSWLAARLFDDRERQ